MGNLTPPLPGFEPGAWRSKRRRQCDWQPTVVTCLCGRDFRQERYGQKYCSLKCRNRRPRNYGADALERRRQSDRERDKRRPRIHGLGVQRSCERCRKQFASKPNEQPRYCSRQCAIPDPKPKSCRIYIRNCTYCGELFVGRSRKARVCRKHPRSQAGYPRRIGMQGTKACASCGGSITFIQGFYGKGRQRVCDDCRELAKKVARRNAKRIRRARERGARTEPYSLPQIAKRDHYRCGLCHKRVAMTKTVPHAKAPTIDHIIPLSKGGDDIKANVQLAHFICNSLTSDGGSKQLRLVG